MYKYPFTSYVGCELLFSALLSLFKYKNIHLTHSTYSSHSVLLFWKFFRQGDGSNGLLVDELLKDVDNPTDKCVDGYDMDKELSDTNYVDKKYPVGAHFISDPPFNYFPDRQEDKIDEDLIEAFIEVNLNYCIFVFFVFLF